MSAERDLWSLYEPVHAIVYFEASISGCLADRGLHGFWNGYFAGRAASLGAVGPGPVTALFFGFAPDMVAKALPKVWGRVSPEDVLEARYDAVDRFLSGHLDSSDDVRRATEVLVRAAEGLDPGGRALAAAWQSVPPAAPVARLWWATTVLREYRGDGHVLAATHAGLNGLETTLTHIGAGVVTRPTMQPNRGWTDEQWAAAEDRLRSRGLLDGDNALTSAGAELRARIEAETDRLATPSLRAVEDELPLLRQVLVPLGRAIAAAGALPAGNPMGLPAID